jgi:DNA-binding NarL/FixJ family response regulator
VVDDLPEVRTVLARVLSGSGRYAVAETESALGAMQILVTDPPDAMILDISMPERSGLSVISDAHSVAPDTKIVVMSSHEGMEQEVLAMGAHAFLPKTASPKLLLKTLAAVLAE